MTELRREAYQEADVKRLELFEEMTVQSLPDWWKLYDVFSLHGPAYTFYRNDKAVMCAGIVLCFPGMGEAWLVADRAIKQFPYAAFRALLDSMEQHIEQDKLHRVQANTISSWRGAIHFIEKMGFEKECTMRKAGPAGEDRDLFARVK